MFLWRNMANSPEIIPVTHCAPIQSGQNLHCLSYGILWLGKHHGISVVRQGLSPFSITCNI